MKCQFETNLPPHVTSNLPFTTTPYIRQGKGIYGYPSYDIVTFEGVS